MTCTGQQQSVSGLLHCTPHRPITQTAAELSVPGMLTTGLQFPELLSIPHRTQGQEGGGAIESFYEYGKERERERGFMPMLMILRPGNREVLWDREGIIYIGRMFFYYVLYSISLPLFYFCWALF